MLYQICRGLWLSILLQIFWGSAQQTRVGTQWLGNQTRIFEDANSYGSIHTRCNQIHILVIQINAQLQLWVLFLKVCQGMYQHMIAEARGCCDV